MGLNIKASPLIAAATVTSALIAASITLPQLLGNNSKTRTLPQCQGQAVQLPANKVVLEGDPWSGYAPFRNKELLAGTSIAYLYREELDQSKRACNLKLGHSNFLVTTANQVMSQKMDGQIVAVVDISMGADALVLNSRKYSYLKTVYDLPRLVSELKAKGQKPVIAYTGDSPSDFLLRKLASTYDALKLENFELISVSQSSDALKLLRENKVALAVVWEPDTTAATAEGFSVALTSRHVPGAILDVLVASNSVIKNHPYLVQLMVDRFYDFHAQAQTNQAAFKAFIAKDGSLNEQQTESVLAGIRLFTRAEAADFMVKVKAPLYRTEMMQAISGIASVVSEEDASVKADESLVNKRFIQKNN